MCNCKCASLLLDIMQVAFYALLCFSCIRFFPSASLICLYENLSGLTCSHQLITAGLQRTTYIDGAAYFLGVRAQCSSEFITYADT